LTARDALTAARNLVDRPLAETEGLWARAAAILGRQALEEALRSILDREAPGARAAPFTTQLVLLRALHDDRELAGRVAYTWAALSRATHHQGYELPPPVESLRGWLDVVDELVGVA
jgi:hypothetical protein